MQKVSDLLPNIRHTERDAKCNSPSVLNLGHRHLVSVMTTLLQSQCNFPIAKKMPVPLVSLHSLWVTLCSAGVSPAHTFPWPLDKENAYFYSGRTIHIAIKMVGFLRRQEIKTFSLSDFQNKSNWSPSLSFSLHYLSSYKLIQPRRTTQVTPNLMAVLTKAGIVGLIFQRGTVTHT